MVRYDLSEPDGNCYWNPCQCRGPSLYNPCKAEQGKCDRPDDDEDSTVGSEECDEDDDDDDDDDEDEDEDED